VFVSKSKKGAIGRMSYNLYDNKHDVNHMQAIDAPWNKRMSGPGAAKTLNAITHSRQEEA
jgi:hypothetical protein